MVKIVCCISWWCCFLLLLLCAVRLTETQNTGACRTRACYPPTVDLLQSLNTRTITVGSTCGNPAESFDLRFAGEFQDTYQSMQCDAADATLSHTKDFLYDFSTQNIFGNEYTRPRLDTWWQSANTEQDVMLEVAFGDSFLFQETVLSFRSVRPLAMKVEKSNDFGQTWVPLHYYAQDCTTSFPGVTTTSNSYNLPYCEQKYYYGDTETAAVGEEIQLVEYSPAGDLGSTFYQQAVLEYFSVTNVRITLAKTGMAAPDTRSYFAVADWIVTGQCLCFGHALSCSGASQSECVCQHNTQGPSCTECKPLFNNKPWMAGRGNSANACEDCDCGGFATSCIYDEVKGYGVCQECTENTMGDKCEMCIDHYYRNPNYTDPGGDDNGNTCIVCGCSRVGTERGTVCNETDGQCVCKANVGGRRCDECKDTFHNLVSDNPSGCQECLCNEIGSLGSTNFCDKETGQCICKTNVMGETCDTCKDGTFNLDINNPDGCTVCECDIGGSVDGQCRGELGLCECRPNIAGRSCDETMTGFYVPKLDGIIYEAEMANNNRDVAVLEEVIDLDDSDNVTSRHTGPGFMVVSPSDELSFSNVRIPRTQRYALFLRHKSKATWSTITINLTPQSTQDFECGGTTISGSAPINLTPGTITPAESGGAAQFGSNSIPCLGEGLYDITVTFATSSGGSTDTLLLDSLVLLPRLEDIGIFTSADTPDSTKQDMRACWDAAGVAYDPFRETSNCSAVEFSLMAEVYNGAISCSCEGVGTEPNTQCDSHGGQCICRPEVIGRSCDSCMANHYGYDTGNGCTACNCDALGSDMLSCNQTSGECDCKIHVIGSKCDECRPEHYGISSGNGCTPCICNMDYSLHRNCDLETGQCACKPGVGGMNCNQCASGYYNLTTSGCMSCGCNFDGITEDGGCDDNGQCVCRQDATGEQCDMCPERLTPQGDEVFTYGFGPWSERGCIRCYCSAHSYNCTEASGWLEASVVSRFSLINTGAVSPRWTGIDVDTNTTVDVQDIPVLSVTDPRIILEIIDPTNLTSIFFKSPQPYHGDKRTAYGQMFTFTLSQSTTSDPLIDPDGDVFIYSRFASEPIAASLPAPPGLEATRYSIKLHEKYWKKGTMAGVQPTTEEMIHILAGITSIQIRAKYTALNKESVIFHEAELEFAVDGAASNVMYTVSSIPAMFVELCNCPPEYEGNFCEQCAPGYRWQSTDLGPFSGCVTCDCNGHSDLPCDQETGACQSCQHNTAGDTCQLCQDGYYGDATRGTPDDCQPCMCPGPPAENSFSPTCDGSGVCLECADGHLGNNCETCATGYYGVPTDIQNNGGQCRACFCSLSPAECNSITGQCLNCQGNTGGLTCDVCDDGYWGNIANCQECNCDPLGGDGSCTQDQGICVCHPNVIGDRCTQCAPNSWGFNSGDPGCTMCDCHPIGTAFGASQCDMDTGQCDCKERVTSLQCDACIDGYYNVNQQCIACECNTDGTLGSSCNAEGVCSCNVTTGQCTCMLDTIAGRTCDRCGRVGDDMMNVVEEVFVGSYPNCEPCPECYQNWRRTLLDLGDNFQAQEQNILTLMQSYGGLTVAEIDSTLDDIRGNLSYAEQAIQEGTDEADELQAIQEGFQQISTGVANMSVLLADIEAQSFILTDVAQDIKEFDGNVEVEPGLRRNAAQLQQELDSLVNTRETYFRLAEASWTRIQEMYQLVESQEIQVQTLQVLTEKLLDDTERAANDRRDARSIIANSERDTEFGENHQRLQQIDAIYREFPLTEASNLAIIAESNVIAANRTVQTAKDLAQQKKTEAQMKSYESEVARFNATAAENAANDARTAAMTYKDVAVRSAEDMASSYLTVLDVNTRLAGTNNRRTEIETMGLQVQAIELRPAEEMTALVETINALNVEDNVQTYYDDAAAGLKTAQETRNTSQLAQMESSSVEALKNTIEYELTQAETVRGNTETSLDASDGYIANINTVAQQVMRRGEEATVQGQTTSDTISVIRQNAQNNDQCLISKRNQAENARDRAQGANLQADSAQQEYIASVEDQGVLRNLISSEMNSKTSAYNDVTSVSESANNLHNDVITTKEMEDLDALITQYIQQRNEMQSLTNELAEMEGHLDAILANLDGASEGSIQCNEPVN